MIPLRLRVEPEEEGGWRLWLAHRDSRDKPGHLPAPAVAGILAALQEATPSAGPVLLVPGDDVEVSAMELAAGRALAPALAASHALSRELAFYLGQVSADSPLLLVVSAADAAQRSLPWELLCESPQGSHLADRGIAIARLADGRPQPPRPARSTLRTLAWVPGGDPLSASLLNALSAATQEHDLPAPEPLADAALPSEDEAAVLHLILHGTVEQEQLSLLVDEDRHGAGGITQQLRAWLPQVDLVVLSVCESGTALREELDGLVGQLIQAGAPAVVAPADELSVEAAEAFSRGLVGALAAGAAVPTAVHTGRQAVRALALPYPDARWHALQLTVGDLNRTAPLIQPGWRPAGWPRPSAVAGQVLTQARALAADSGFIGIEHLLLAMADAPPGENIPTVRFLLRSNRSQIMARLGLLKTDAAVACDERGTLRLRSVGASLEHGFSVADLWQHLIREQHPVLVWYLGGQAVPGPDTDSDATQRLETDPMVTAFGPVDALEVLGGPECGRRLAFAPNARIGRWRAGAAEQVCALALFENTPLRDQTLSRSGVLRWRAPDRVETLSPHIVLYRRGMPPISPDAGAPLWLRPGDALKLSRASWLLATSREHA